MKWSRKNTQKTQPTKKTPAVGGFKLLRKAPPIVDSKLEKAANSLLKGSKTLMKWRQDPRVITLGMILWGAQLFFSSDDRAASEQALDEQFRSGLALDLWQKAAADYPHFDLNTAATNSARDGRIPVRNLLEAIAYMTGEVLVDKQHQRYHDFSDRGDIRFNKLLYPDWSADLVKAENLDQIWNDFVGSLADEPIGTPLAYHLRMPLPYDLSLAQKQALVESFVADTFIADGIIAQYSLIDQQAEYGIPADLAHIIVPSRRLNQAGKWSKFAIRDWLPSDKNRSTGSYQSPDWERQWFEHVTDFIAEYGTGEQIEHHAERMAIDLPDTLPRDEPTKQDVAHLAAWDMPAKQLERRVYDADRSSFNPHPYQMQLIGIGNAPIGDLHRLQEHGSEIRLNLVEMIAYQQGIALSPNHGKQVFDFSDRTDVMLRGLLLPETSPDWLREDGNQEQLWASLSQLDSENQPLAAAFTIPLPQADPANLQELVEDHLETAFTDQGLIAAYAIHLAYSPEGDYAPHLHVHSPLWDLDAEGQWTGKIEPFFQQPEQAAEALLNAWQEQTDEITWEYEPLADEISLPKDTMLTPNWFNQQQSINVRPLQQIPDNRSTWDETEESYFEEGSFNADDPERISGTLIPAYAPDFMADAWRSLLSSHIEQLKIVVDTPLLKIQRNSEQILASHQWIVPLPEHATLPQQQAMLEDYAREFNERGLLFHYVLHPKHDDIAQMHPLTIEAVGLESDSPYLFEGSAQSLNHAHVTVPLFQVDMNGHFTEPHPAWDEPEAWLQWQRDWQEHYLEYQIQQEHEHQAYLTNSQELMRDMMLNLPPQETLWQDMEANRMANMLAQEQEAEYDREWYLGDEEHE